MDLNSVCKRQPPAWRRYTQRLGWILVIALGPLPLSRARADVDGGLRYFQNGQLAEAFQSWRTSALQGDARAALYVGILYDTGLGVGQDYRQALEWYQRAADGGNATAMFNTGVMYDTGHGTPSDSRAAADWYARAAAKGVGRAEYNLALIYESGAGVPRDRDRAVRLYRAAASHAITAARDHLLRLGQPYTGQVRRSEDVALREFQQAEQVLLTRGTGEAARAVALFRRAANDGNALAEYDLGYCYEHGIGVPMQIAQAYDWYRRAAAHASEPAVRTIAEAGARNVEAQLSQAAR